MTTAAKENDASLDAKIQRRKLYLRNIRMLYRKEAKEERSYLTNRVQELEKVVASLRTRTVKSEKPSILSWKDVADALEEDRRHALVKRKSLGDMVARYDVLVKEMQEWVASNMRVTNPPNPRVSTWRNSTLLANSASRQLGKKWILEQMFFNTDLIFQSQGFRHIEAANDFEWDLNFSCGEKGLSIYRRLCNSPLSFEDTIAHFHDTLLALRCYIPGYDPLKPKLLESREGSIQQYVFTTNNEFVNVICGEFRPNPNQCIIVVHGIEHDESFVGVKGRRRSRSLWIDIHRLRDGRTKVRQVSFHSRGFTGDHEFLPVEVDAKDYGVDISACPEAHKECQYAFLMTQRAGAYLSTLFV
ncbi:hypothetical protein LEN26_011872 [Aphanomyces euteiches]|nr:hypothetical protein AeMF1_015324 [Aphanomyces euteiches]KAH9118944.1 hypothetical protein LEN26_011872 [Aphanomyces euteiches]KAH9189849.1 hypothetical protein AeNC1_008175 [Aphanomyces euteiches]